MFKDKNILVGLTGGIACYKTCEIIRELVKSNATVKAVTTKAAQEFIAALTLETLTNNPVYCDQFGSGTIHINLAREADCIVVCPATANTISKVAQGIADNLLTTLISAATIPVVFCPAMNKEMFLNPILQANIRKLKELGYHFIEPDKGELACGEYGWGRLADKKHIIDGLKKIILGTTELQHKKVVITAGPTEEAIDPVRLITNRSSGKMGFALAECASMKSAEVVLISGPNNLQPFHGIKYQVVRTTSEMAEAVFKEFETADILIMAAAVADFRPKFYEKNKIKKDVNYLNLELEKTTDILFEAGQKKLTQIMVGFALETENEITNAIQKLKRKNLDLIVLNNPLDEGAGFGTDTNRVTIFDKYGDKIKLPLMNKFQVAEHILNMIIKMMLKDE